MREDLVKYVETFIDESIELLDMAASELSKFEKKGDITLLNSVMRALHTIKGNAKILELDNISAVAHTGEDAVTAYKKDAADKDNNILVSFIYECLSLIEKGIGNLQNSGSDLTPADLEGLNIPQWDGSNKYTRAESTAQEIEAPVGTLTARDILDRVDDNELKALKASWELGQSIYHVELVLSENVMLLRPRLYLLFKAASEIGNVIYSIPGQEDIEREDVSLKGFGHRKRPVVILLSTEIDESDITKAFDGGYVEDTTVRKLDFSKELDKMERIDEANKNDIDKNGTKRKDRMLRTGTTRVSSAYLDQLLNLVGEGMIAQIRLSQMSHILDPSVLPTHEGKALQPIYEKYGIDPRAMAKVMDTNEQIVKEIQELVLKMRLVPLENIFIRFPRMVRDISRTQNKDIRLEISGSDVEVDRTLLDVIGDALLHTLRNSVDHGIEDKDERSKAGKPAEGHIEIKAYSKGNRITIDIRDDGRGLQRNDIINTAVQRGLASGDELNAMSDEQLFDFLFMPGFTTSKNVTDISGRGVGLDVVRRKLNEVGGKVSVNSAPGEGTKISISLPPVVAILNAMLFSTGDMDFAVPVEYVEETIRTSELQRSSVNDLNAFLVRGEVIPEILINELLALGTSRGEYILVVRTEKGKYGLVVDRIIDRMEIVVKQFDSSGLNNFAGLPRYISQGATILKDGSLALILDVESLLELFIRKHKA